MSQFIKGDRVRITFGRRTVDGIIEIASPNGRSLFLTFDAVLGGFLGGLPVLEEDGVYRDLITHQVAKIEKKTT